jgi:secondary thiamine-phosphate synthase enzyme
MRVTTETLSFDTDGRDDVHDVTRSVREAVRRAGVIQGLVTVFCPGSTGGVTTIEHEPGLVADLKAAVERLVPRDLGYQHNRLQGDDNGHSHVRAALMGPSLAVPVVDGDLTLGTWQQIVFVDFDSHPRRRRLVLQVIGGS